MTIELVLMVVGAHAVAVMAGAMLGAALGWMVWALRPFTGNQRRV